MSRNSPPDAPLLHALLEFWFGRPEDGNTDYSQRRKLWFFKNPETDQLIHDRFWAAYQRAIAGELVAWEHSPQGCLALLILLDQVPRNVFRGTPQAFASDEQALALAKMAIAQGFDRQVVPIQRIFFYLPLEHSESLADQTQSVELFRQLVAEAPDLSDPYDYAIRHYEVVARFGRFPHRNAILQRETTPEEAKFLQTPGSSF